MGDTNIRTTLESLVHAVDITETRRKTLARAIELGADNDVLLVLRDACRVKQKDTIVLPQHHLQTLSRGRGWCRSLGKTTTVWGERTEEGDYEVGPGRWSVGATDGFSRKKSTDWTVKNIQVGTECWTVAN